MPKRRLLSVGFIVDTNCVNSRQRIPALNQLESWAANDVIELMTSQVAQDEALAGNDALRREKAYSFMFTMSAISVQQEGKMTGRLMTLVVALLTLGCTSLAPGAEKVKLTRNAADVAGCKALGLVSGLTGTQAFPGAEDKMRNAAAALGADVVFVTSSVGSYDGVAYRCAPNGAP